MLIYAAYIDLTYLMRILKIFDFQCIEHCRFHNIKIYFPQKTQNTNKYSDSYITTQNTIKSFLAANGIDNTKMREQILPASHIR